MDRGGDSRLGRANPLAPVELRTHPLQPGRCRSAVRTRVRDLPAEPHLRGARARLSHIEPPDDLLRARRASDRDRLNADVRGALRARRDRHVRASCATASSGGVARGGYWGVSGPNPTNFILSPPPTPRRAQKPPFTSETTRP